MENRIIVKKAMRVDSTGKIPASRVLGAFVCFLLFALGVAMILVGLLDPEYSTFALGGLVVAAVGVGFFARYYTLIRQGHVEAIITEEGIAVRKSGFTVIPWAINKFRDRLNQADISPDSTDTTTK